MILLLDNYDSFVYNLDRYLRRLGQNTLVVRSDAVTVDAISRLEVDAIVISPGPKSPDDAGCSMEVVRRFGKSIPILGVCLGHQSIGQAFGGTIVRAETPMHGKQSRIRHAGTPLFAHIPETFEVGRYHSLIVDLERLPDDLRVTAWGDERTTHPTIMAIEHVTWPIYGLQFHPESILTQHGYQLLINFLTIAGLPTSSVPKSDW